MGNAVRPIGGSRKYLTSVVHWVSRLGMGIALRD